MMNGKPWASFCISTYKRPARLDAQLRALLSQTFTGFEIVVSDNDPEASGRVVVEEIGDSRIRYFHNGENIGMIPSFNKSIERSTGEYLVMVTDDDPVDASLLAEMSALHLQFPGYSLYGGFLRLGKRRREVEVVRSGDFVSEILDPRRTKWMLWSSCILDRRSVMTTGKIPDYGSPHLADHALIAKVGSLNGGIIINRAFSSLTSHDTNYSKLNFDSYVVGCKGFYETMIAFSNGRGDVHLYRGAIESHLRYWLKANVFGLKRYYTVRKPDPQMISKINSFAREVLEFPFMGKAVKIRFFFKEMVFRIKSVLGLLNFN